MLTCVGVANSSMNPDPEPVHAGPIQVFILAGPASMLKCYVCMVPHITTLAPLGGGLTLHRPGFALCTLSGRIGPMRARTRVDS